MRKKQNEYNVQDQSCLFAVICRLSVSFDILLQFLETFTYLKASQAAVFQLLAWRHRFIFCFKISSYFNSRFIRKSECAARTRSPII